MKKFTLTRLFFTTLYISAFTFGGGFVIVTLMKRKLVDELKWLSDEEMLDMTAISQSAPGAIAVNAAILTGWRLARFKGMLVSVAATVLPPLVILSVISFFYAQFASNMYIALILRGMQAGVAAVVADVTVTLARSIIRQKRRSLIAAMAIALILALVFKVDSVLIIAFAALTGIAYSLTVRKTVKPNDIP